MIREPVFSEVEGPLFAGELGVVSTPRALVASMTAHRLVQELVNSVRSASDVDALRARIQALAGMHVDEKYCHPYDLPVATYLLVLAKVSPRVAKDLAKATLKVRNFWWGRILALQVLQGVILETTTLRSRYDLLGGHEVRAAAHVTNTRTTSPRLIIAPSQRTNRLLPSAQSSTSAGAMGMNHWRFSTASGARAAA